MTRSVVWSENALADTLRIFDYIALESVQNAHLVADRIEQTVALLLSTPFGRTGRMPNTFEAIVPKTPFIIAYHLSDECLSIVRVIHGARDWQKGEWPK